MSAGGQKDRRAGSRLGGQPEGAAKTFGIGEELSRAGPSEGALAGFAVLFVC